MVIDFRHMIRLLIEGFYHRALNYYWKTLIWFPRLPSRIIG